MKVSDWTWKHFILTSLFDISKLSRFLPEDIAGVQLRLIAAHTGGQVVVAHQVVGSADTVTNIWQSSWVHLKHAVVQQLVQDGWSPSKKWKTNTVRCVNNFSETLFPEGAKFSLFHLQLRLKFFCFEQVYNCPDMLSNNCFSNFSTKNVTVATYCCCHIQSTSTFGR